MLIDWSNKHKNALNCYMLKKQIIAKISESSVTYPLPILVRIKKKRTAYLHTRQLLSPPKTGNFRALGIKVGNAVKR